MEHASTEIRLKDVRKTFPVNGGGSKNVLDGLCLELLRSLFFSLIGPNGCGKSTLLNIIAGLLSPDAGSCEVSKSDGNSAKVGYVWQDYRASLLPWLNVFDNVAFPLRLRGMRAKDRRRIVGPIIEEFMPGVNARDFCYSLSGGLQQLVSVLRSTTIEPDVMLLDEPFSALDQQRSWNMALHVERIWAARPVPAIFVSHDVDEAILMADEILLMSREGRIETVLRNTLPRPRSINMLTSGEHLRCRSEVLAFLAEQNLTTPPHAAIERSVG